MEMPTPCNECNDVVEFNDMVNVNGRFMCDECANDHQCDQCGDHIADVSEMNVNDEGKFCETCFDMNYC